MAPTAWSAGDLALIAATAVVLSALLAALGAFITSLVNAWSAQRIARDTARRQILTESFKPFLDRINEHIQNTRDLIQARNRIVMHIQRGSARKQQEPEPKKSLKDDPDFQEIQKILQKLIEGGETHIDGFYDTRIYGHRDQSLADAIHDWTVAHTNLFEEFNAAGGVLTTDRSLEEKLLPRMVDLVTTGANLRIDVQGFIIGRPIGFAARYRVWRQFRLTKRWTRRKLGWEKPSEASQ